MGLYGRTLIAGMAANPDSPIAKKWKYRPPASGPVDRAKAQAIFDQGRATLQAKAGVGAGSSSFMSPASTAVANRPRRFL